MIIESVEVMINKSNDALNKGKIVQYYNVKIRIWRRS